MVVINDVTNFETDSNIAILTLNSPPVNALSAQVREGLHEGIKKAKNDKSVEAIVLICKGRTFIAGADITEFGKEPQGPSLFEALDMIENSNKPVIAAIHGTALGGGLEVALTCHYRIAIPSAKCGLPEVQLGLLPGAGGTQRLPRVVGVEKALQMVTSGQIKSYADLEAALMRTQGSWATNIGYDASEGKVRGTSDDTWDAAAQKKKSRESIKKYKRAKKNMKKAKKGY